MIGLGLRKFKPGHNKRQNTITSNWRGDRQAQRGEIFQQT